MASIPVNCSAQQLCLTPLGAVSRRQQSSSRAVCSSSGAQSQRLLSGTPLQGVGRIYAATSRRQQKVCFGYCAIFCRALLLRYPKQCLSSSILCCPQNFHAILSEMLYMQLVTRMGLFGLGIPEVAVIAGVAVLIFGELQGSLLT